MRLVGTVREKACDLLGGFFDREFQRFIDVDIALGYRLCGMAARIGWGRFEAIETFCVDHALVFARWAGGASGAFGPERVVFDGTTVRSFSASDDDEILISAETVRRLGSYAAVLSHLAAAELEIPPFRIDGAG